MSYNNHITVTLKRPHKIYDGLIQVDDFQSLCCLGKQGDRISLIFSNEMTETERKYILHNLKLLKKKKFEEVLQHCIKLLKINKHFIWGYMVAAAATRNCDKYVHWAPYYFSQALLINPNCTNAWSCLFKYYKDNIFVESIIFETVFSGILQTELDFKKWSALVSNLLEMSSGICFDIREPLKLLAPFIYSSSFDNREFLEQAITKYIVENLKKKHLFYEINIALEALKQNAKFDKEIVEKMLSYTLLSDLNWHFNEFVLNIFDKIDVFQDYFRNTFLKKLLVYLSYCSLNSTNEICQKMIIVFPKHMRIIRKHLLSYLNLICFSFADYRRIRDNYGLIRKKVIWPRSRDRLTYRHSLIKLNHYKLAWKEVHHALREVPYHQIKKRRANKQFKKKIIINSFLHQLLHLLTHGYSKTMRKLGVLLCLKIIYTNQPLPREILFNACIGCIGLDERDLAVKLLFKLLKLGAINEIIFLKALMETSYKGQLLILSAIQEFSCSYKLRGVLACKYEPSSKSSKTILKSSVLSPEYSYFSEWLGIYNYEKGNNDVALQFFEIALFYNPSSWISINYYSDALSKVDLEASKSFLQVCAHANRKKCLQSSLISLKTAMYYIKFKSEQMDYYSSCEHLRHAMYILPLKRCIKEILAESYSFFGMIGVSEKWYKECYIVDEKRHIYAGSQLGKQYLFKYGTNKYKNHMREILCKSNLDTFISLYNSAHAFLMRSIKVFLGNKHYLSQVYCQQALFMCVRAVMISSRFACLWKMMGDIFYQCGSLKDASGFLCVPHWLFVGYTDKKLVLVRRFQLLRLAVRCYYTGLNASVCNNKIKACLWNSIATAYRKISNFCERKNKSVVLQLAIGSSLKALDTNIFDCLSWNILGILISQRGPVVLDTYSKSYFAIDTGIKLCRPFIFNLFFSGNIGFLSLSYSDFNEAYHGFLFTRGRCTTLDFPWIGQIFLHILYGDTLEAVKNILFIYCLTNHFPTISILFSYLLFLGNYCSRDIIRLIGKKYGQFCESGISPFKNCLLSCLVNLKKGNYNVAKQNLFFALRTCNQLNNKAVEDYNAALHELHFLISSQREQSTILNLSHQYVSNKEQAFLLCKTFIKGGLHENAYVELLKCLTFEKNLVARKIIYLALTCISHETGSIEHAKYYFNKSNEYD